MGLTNKKEEELKQMPKLEARVSKSKDGKYIIHRVIITHIRPVNYYTAIIDDAHAIQEEELEKEFAEA